MAKKSLTIVNSGGGGGAFLTQKGEKIAEVKHEISELEQLLAAAGQTSQSTLLLKKRKEMREVDESLETMKTDYKRRMDVCEDRRLQFEQKQAKMREQVQKFEKFIQENDAKRMRAEAKAKQERKLYEDKVKEIALLADRMQKLEQEQRRLSEELAKQSKYKAFLEQIVEDGEYGYEEIAEVLNRENTLREANSDLMDHSAQQEKEVDEFRKKLLSLRTEKQNQLLVSNSVLQQSQQDLEKMRSNVKIQEEEKLQRENKKKDISKELSQITQAIKNLFGRCFSTMRIKPSFVGNKDTPSISEILDYELGVIHMRISDLVEISQEFRQSLETAAAVAAAAAAAAAAQASLGAGPAGTDLREASLFSLQTLNTPATKISK